MLTARHRSGGPVAWQRLFPAAALLLSLFVAGRHPANADASLAYVAVSHVPELVAAAKPLGHIAATPAMDVEFVLPLRNQAQLTDELNRIADPKDPLYGHYLTPRQFADEYGPSLADVNAVARFAKNKGLSLKDVSDNRTLIKVSGPSGTVESAFGVRINNYQALGGRVFFAPDREPAFPADIAHRIIGVTGLDNARLDTPSSHMIPKVPTLGSLPAFAQPLDSEQPQDVIGTGPTIAGYSTIAPNDIRSIYTIPNVSSPGSGQTLAVFELSGYTPSDITGYDNNYYPSLAAVPLQNVLVDGYDGSAGPGADEVSLDLEMMIALCPYATKIICYEAPNNATGDEEEYAKIASDNLASIVSSSWGGPETGTSPNAEGTSENQSFQQMASQGQSFFVASGDSGAYANETSTSPGTLSVQDPGSQPYATSVGGTLMNDSSSEAYVSESAWNAPSNQSHGESGTGSGGGISAWWPIPSYQSGFANTSNKGSTTQRNDPDVSLFGDFDEGYYSFFYQGGLSGSNGTSAAAPLWAAYIALVNQGRASHGSPKIGFINPAVYSLASNTTTYNDDFHDVNDGTTNLYYPAVTGYDLATGLGSPKGTTLYNNLVAYGVSSAPTVTSFTPTSGPVGTVITVTGTHLNGVTAVRFHNANAATFSANGAGTQLTVTVPTGAGTGTFTITTPGGSVKTTGTFTVTTTVSQPTITSFSPTSGSVGTSVTITGTHLSGASAVTFHGTASTFSIVSDTQITATVPTGTTTGTITVTTPGGTATSSSSFTVTTASVPTVTSFTPTSGPVGTVITVTGTHLNGVTAVRFHNANATTFSANGAGTSLTVTVPTGAGTGTFTITTPGGSVKTTGTFTVTTGPAITLTGFAASPTTVAPGGTFGLGAVISSAAPTGGVSVTLTQNGTAQSPIVIAAGQTSGGVSYTAGSTPTTYTFSASYGGVTKTATVSVTAATPTITSFAPTSGSVGTVVTVTGTNLNGVTAVRFHNANATVFSANGAGTMLTVTVPSGAGTGTFTVTTPGGSVTSTGTFTVTAAAALSSLACSPGTVQESANFTVTATLTAPAPASGASVSLSLSGTTESPIAIAAGQTSGSVTYTAGTTPGTYTFTASYGGATKTASFTVAAPNGTLTGFSFSPSTVAGGSTTTGYLVFSAPLTSAVSVTVLSADGYDESYTCSPDGSVTTYTFSATPNQTSSTYTDTFTAYGPNNSVSTDLTVTAP